MKSFNKRDFQPFAGDSSLQKHFIDICQDHNIDTIIETGTYVGGSTKEFAKMAKNVITIEHELEYFQHASLYLSGIKNIEMIYGSSISHLKKCIEKASGNLLFFLDAHWGPNNPLLGELDIIKKSGVKPIIGIHDMKNPNHPEYAYDTYGSITYEWDWIKNSVEAIYGNNYEIKYNDNAVGVNKVGVIFIFPS